MLTKQVYRVLHVSILCLAMVVAGGRLIPAQASPVMQVGETRLEALEAGSTVRDTLNQSVTFRLYWFVGQEGEQAMVTPGPETEFQPLFVLYDASFVEQQRAASSVMLTANLPRNGMFFLAVALPDTVSPGGSYEFTFDLGRDLVAQGNFTDIAYGQSQRGTIDANTPAVTYRFRGSLGDTVTVTMSRAGGDLNSYLYLMDGTGELLYEDNDSGGENGNARMVYALPADGEYLIIATRLGRERGTTSGSYLLELLSDAPVPVETETTIALPPDYEGLPQIGYGDTVEDEISDARFMDVYVFLGFEGDRITIEMASQNAAEFRALDPFLILLDDERIPLVENDDIIQGQDRDARIEFTLPRTAYYSVVATRFDQEVGTSTGPYTLMLRGPGAVAEEAGNAADTMPVDQLSTLPLGIDEPMQGVFDTGAELYTFTVSVDTPVDLLLTTDSGQDAVLILSDEELVEIVSSSTGALENVGLTEGNRYLVIAAQRFGPIDSPGDGYVLALGQGTGEEEVVAAEEEIPEGPQPIRFDETVTGVIDDQIVSRLYTFEGLAGQTIRVTMEAAAGSELDCYLELRNAEDTLVEANDDINPGVVRDSQIVTELLADGEYTLIASRYVGEDAPVTSGAFRLTLEYVGEDTGVSSEITSLAYGETLVDEISDEQYLVFFVFQGTAGDVVTVSLEHLSGNLDSVLHLYQGLESGWVEIASNDDSPTGGT
jgi:hypothetical protein